MSRKFDDDCLKSVKTIIRALKHEKYASCGRKRKLETRLAELLSKECKERNVSKPEQSLKTVKWVRVISAFKGRILSGAVVNLTHKEPALFMKDAFILIKQRLSRRIKKFKCLKVNFVFVGEFVKEHEGVVETSVKYFTTKNFELVKSSNLRQLEANVSEDINQQLIESSERGSGWALREIINLTVNINKICKFSTNK